MSPTVLTNSLSLRAVESFSMDWASHSPISSFASTLKETSLNPGTLMKNPSSLPRYDLSIQIASVIPHSVISHSCLLMCMPSTMR